MEGRKVGSATPFLLMGILVIVMLFLAFTMGRNKGLDDADIDKDQITEAAQVKAANVYYDSIQSLASRIDDVDKRIQELEMSTNKEFNEVQDHLARVREASQNIRITFPEITKAIPVKIVKNKPGQKLMDKLSTQVKELSK